MGKLHRIGLMPKLRFCALVWLSAILVMPAIAQDNCDVYGVVKDQDSFKKMEGVNITVLKDGKEVESFPTSVNGKYELHLVLGSTYKLVYSKQGYISKNVVLDTKAIPEEDRAGGFQINLDMTLFQEIEGFDKKVTEQPIGKASFNPLKNDLEFDFEYTARVQREIEAELARLANAAGDKEKKLKQFNDLVAAGDRDMLAKKYEGAFKNFGEALKLFPEDKPVQAKLAEAQSLWDAEKNAAKLEEEYQRLLSEGQSNLDRKNYEAAKSKFTEASAKKPQERLPKDKIKEIDDLLKGLANRDAFNALVAEGDKKLTSKEYALAIEKYNEALKLLPAEQYPKDKIREAQAMLDALLASEQEKAEKEKRYKELIALADKNFTSSNFQEAKKQYNEALGIKSGEKHPTDRIAEIDRVLADLAAKEEANKNAAKLEEEYQRLLSEGQSNLDKKNYEAAKAKFTEASTKKPQERLPKDKIKEIDDILKGLANRDAFNALVAEGDKKLTSKEYALAIEKYNEALKLIPSEQYPKDKIREAQAILDANVASEQERAEKEKRYKELIALADKNFTSSNYQEAKKQYNEALGIKSGEKHPTDRIAEIDRVLADLAAKEEANKNSAKLEEEYQRLLSEGQSNLDKKNYEAAKAKFTEASNKKPQERLPKDKIKEIDDILKGLANRDAFNALVAEADKKFANKDYALSIEKYNEALKLFPSEQYPKDKIQEAKEMLDSMLTSEQEKAEREKRYKELVALADKNFIAANYQEAKKQYNDALGVKPGEKHPSERLTEIERILADLAAKEEAERMAALDNAEKEKLEREYNEKIQLANSLFDRKEYENARITYSEASEMKPLDKFPKSRIQRIDEILAEQEMAAKNAEEEEARKKMEEDRLAQDRARMDDDRRAEEDRLRKLEEERLQRERIAEEARRRKDDDERRRRSLNNTDTSTEDEVERYYREAKASEDAAKYNEIKNQKDREESFFAQETDQSSDRRNSNIDAASERKDNMEVIYRKGTELQWESSRGKAEEIERWESQDVERNENHGMKRLMSSEIANDIKARFQAISSKDSIRGEYLAEAERKKAESQSNQQEYESRGKTLAADNYNDVTIEKQKESVTAERGHLVWLDKKQASEDRKEQVNTDQIDAQLAANEGLANRYERKEREKDKLESIGNGKEDDARDKQKNVEEKKEREASFQDSKSRDSNLRRDASRFDRFSKDSGGQKDPEDYNLPEGAEDLQEGVNETSYELPGKTVIERTVKIGNKVDVYRKVVSKTGTFYFKNNKSITEVSWKRETLNLKD